MQIHFPLENYDMKTMKNLEFELYIWKAHLRAKSNSQSDTSLRIRFFPKTNVTFLMFQNIAT